MSGRLEAWGEDQPDEADMDTMGHEGLDAEGMEQKTVMAETHREAGDRRSNSPGRSSTTRPLRSRR